MITSFLCVLQLLVTLAINPQKLGDTTLYKPIRFEVQTGAWIGNAPSLPGQSSAAAAFSPRDALWISDVYRFYRLT